MMLGLNQGLVRLWHWQSILFNTRLDLIHIYVVCCYFKYLMCGPGSESVGSITLTQCCGSGSGIRCLFDAWIRDPGWVKNQDPETG
jgi:hypothetical protein